MNGGPLGDLHCRVQIETPIHLTKEQREWVKNLGESLSGGGKHHSPQEHSWTDGVKSFFEKLTG